MAAGKCLTVAHSLGVVSSASDSNAGLTVGVDNVGESDVDVISVGVIWKF